jgi:hypothetical protein
MYYYSTLLSNHRLIMLKRFVSQNSIYVISYFLVYIYYFMYVSKYSMK